MCTYVAAYCRTDSSVLISPPCIQACMYVACVCMVIWIKRYHWGAVFGVVLIIRLVDVLFPR